MGLLLLAGSMAHAGVIFDSGIVAFNPTGTQFGRVSRNGLASDWGEVKLFPGVSGTPTERAYESFQVDIADRTFVQISLDDPSATLFCTAYYSDYEPVNAAPNYGLDVHYLGDAGTSQPFGNPSFFQIVATRNSTLTIVVNELNPGAATGHSFEVWAEGFYDASYSETPEPASLLLAGGALAFGMLIGRQHPRSVRPKGSLNQREVA